MDEKNIQEQINGINSKLDIILEEIALQRRHRLEVEDLKEDLMRVGKDLYQSTVTELEEVHDHLDTGDILFLGKKLLRNVKTLTKTFEQLEGVRDFVNDFAPISKELTIDFMNKLDEFDRKGYFEFAKEFTKAIDNVVTSFTPGDVKALGENMVTIINTVKNLTQPDMLNAINNAVNVYNNLDIKVEENVSTLALLKELNTPETKKAMSFALRFLKNLSQQQEDVKLIKTENTQTI
ncbi:MAG: DUF1641 domain-containing protein [Bacteroidetes bacterium]|nr:DUF1641 domain-containing protein [Bacteroidota bacterium]